VNHSLLNTKALLNCLKKVHCSVLDGLSGLPELNPIDKRSDQNAIAEYKAGSISLIFSAVTNEQFWRVLITC